MAQLDTETVDDVREAVREKYAATARAAARSPASAVCCSPADATGVFGVALYDGEAVDGTAGAALAASLGCRIPTVVADLREGEVVLDLGSGAGADVLISARRVGPTGSAIGLDMTDEMLAENVAAEDGGGILSRLIGDETGSISSGSRYAEGQNGVRPR